MIHRFTDVEHFLGDQDGGPRSRVLVPVEGRRADREGARASDVGPAGDVLAWFSLSLAWWHPERTSDPLALFSLAGMAEGPSGSVAARWM